MTKQKAKLKDWKIMPYGLNDKYYVSGIIIEDKIDRGFIGKFISTSTLIKIDLEKRIAETKNTIYELA